MPGQSYLDLLRPSCRRDHLLLQEEKPDEIRILVHRLLKDIKIHNRM
jgi:hypothetical protein